MDDHYRMIEQNIESLLDEKQESFTFEPMETTPAMTRPGNFLSYKTLEMAAKEGPILGQYKKWSTVESDELHVSNHSVEQPNNTFAPMLPVSMNNLTVDMMQNIINFLNVRLHNNIMTMPKRTCSFCKKNGMNVSIYTSHSLRVNGVLQCPYLLKCQCTNCWKNGHTTTLYCRNVRRNTFNTKNEYEKVIRFTSYCPMKERITSSIPSAFFDRNYVNQH